jgi:Tsp45I type II restriction enzyme
MTMNYWTELSIEYANQKSYLDDLFQVYPTIPEGIREIKQGIWKNVEKAFEMQDNILLIKELLKLDLFPIKDSYIAFLKRDDSAIERNPKTINRICGRLYEMGLDKIFEKCTEPKETNRQIGPFFRRWLNKKSLGVQPATFNEFTKSKDDAILDGSDQELAHFAREILNYQRDKGLDFVGRFNNKYVIGESKFLTDFGGHQNTQFADAITTLQTPNVEAVKIAVLDGVLYIKGKNKMYRDVTTKYKDYNIMSALVLREFLYQL